MTVQARIDNVLIWCKNTKLKNTDKRGYLSLLMQELGLEYWWWTNKTQF